MKGKPWTSDEEARLRQMLAANRSVCAIAKSLCKIRDCVRMKIARLGLEVVVQEQKNSPRTTTTNLTDLQLPSELPSVEEQLKVLAAALETLRKAQLLRKHRHQSLCTQRRWALSSGFLPSKTVDIRNSPACTYGFS